MHDHDPPSDEIRRACDALAAVCLGYPEAHEDNPWGERAFKVKGKVFVFASATATGLSCTVKLPVSHAEALDEPFASRTGYGLGKHGWVSARFAPGDTIPFATLRAWIDESFRAVAPKKLVKQLDLNPSG